LNKKLVIKLHSSALLGAVMTITHVAALIIFVWIDIALWTKLLMFLVVLASVVDVFRRKVLRVAADAVTEVEMGAEGKMKLIFKDGCQLRISRIYTTFINPVITLITVGAEGRRFPLNVVIPLDAIDKEDHRELRVQLKYFSIG